MFWKFINRVVEELQEFTRVEVAAGSYNAVDQGGGKLTAEIRAGEEVAPVGGVGEDGDDLARQFI